MTQLQQHISDAFSRLQRKSEIIIHMADKPSIKVEVGEEWNDPKFIQGVHVKQIRPYYDNDESTIIAVDGIKKTVMDAHYHTNDELLICAKGSIRINIGGKEKILNKLDTERIPAFSVHSFEFLEDSLIFMIWVPKFPEFNMN